MHTIPHFIIIIIIMRLDVSVVDASFFLLSGTIGSISKYSIMKTNKNHDQK